MGVPAFPQCIDNSRLWSKQIRRPQMKRVLAKEIASELRAIEASLSGSGDQVAASMPEAAVTSAPPIAEKRSRPAAESHEFLATASAGAGDSAPCLVTASGQRVPLRDQLRRLRQTAHRGRSGRLGATRLGGVRRRPPGTTDALQSLLRRVAATTPARSPKTGPSGAATGSDEVRRLLSGGEEQELAVPEAGEQPVPREAPPVARPPTVAPGLGGLRMSALLGQAASPAARERASALLRSVDLGPAATGVPARDAVRKRLAAALAQPAVLGALPETPPADGPRRDAATCQAPSRPLDADAGGGVWGPAGEFAAAVASERPTAEGGSSSSSSASAAHPSGTAVALAAAIEDSIMREQAMGRLPYDGSASSKLGEGYSNFSKALIGALSRGGGSELRDRILGGEVAPAELARMQVEALAPAALRSKRQAIRRAVAESVDAMAEAVAMGVACPACRVAGTVRGLQSGAARDIRKSEIWGGASKADGGTVRCVCDNCGHGWVIDA